MTSPDPLVPLALLRASHDRLTALTADLDGETLTGPSYDTEWTIAQVLSHLGSGSTIFGLYLDAVRDRTPVPGVEVFRPIWAEWDAADPTWQRDRSIERTGLLLDRLDALDEAQRESFTVTLYGGPMDLADFVGNRLIEHAVHTWDVAVMFDPTAGVAVDAVPLLVPRLAPVASQTGRPAAIPYRVRITTTDPADVHIVSVGETEHSVSLGPPVAGGPAETYDGEITLPAEAYVRLVYGRLDKAHVPPALTESGTRGIADLRATFPGV